MVYIADPLLGSNNPGGGPYTPFFNLSEAVLKSMGSIHGIPIQHADLVELNMRSETMPAHPDVPAGLKQLKDAGFRLVTLSNSPQGAQIIQLRHAGIVVTLKDC